MCPEHRAVLQEERRGDGCGRGALLCCVGEELHEAIIHVQLLMTVEEGRPGIVGQEVDIDGVVARQTDGVFQDAAHRRLPDTRELEAMPVQVYRMGQPLALMRRSR